MLRIPPTTSTRRKAYLAKWLETVAKPRLRERTLASYTDLAKRYIVPKLGDRRLDQLRPADVQQFYADLQQRGLSPRTVRYVHAVLRSALGQAVKWNTLPRNVATLVDLPKQQRKEMQALSPEQAERFLQAAASDRFGCLFTLALITGCRPGEYLAAQWKDIDFDTGMVTIQRAITDGKDGWTFSEPKTARSRRSIPLPPVLLRMLQEHRKRQAEERLAAGPSYRNYDLIFANAVGEPLDRHNLAVRHFKPLLRAAGLPESLRLYDLRHSCATLLLAAGEHPKVAAERLGHASTVMTIDVYSHVVPTMQQRATERLESMLFSGRHTIQETGTL